MHTPSRHTLSVPRTAHYAFLGDPATPPAECWYVCHGYGQLAHRFIRRFQVLDAPFRWVVAPEGLSRYYLEGAGGKVGASWMTKEDRQGEIADYVGFLGALHGHVSGAWHEADPELVVLGFSQGCATASRWVARGTVTPTRLVLWGEVQAHDLTEDDLARLRDADVRVDFVIGREDRAVPLPSVERAAAAAKDAGLHATIHVFDGGHEIDDATLLRIGEPGVDD